MAAILPTLIATSVVRGSHQGESHGGVYLLDFATGEAEQRLDWNTVDIDFTGRGADRGLRGIEFYDEQVYIAASDELFCFDRDFQLRDSWRNPYLKHCHEICRMDNMLFLTSTGYDSILAFDLARKAYTWGLFLQGEGDRWQGFTFDPQGEAGPRPSNALHLNMVHVDRKGIFVSGLRTRALLRASGGSEVSMICSLPEGCHNARPFADGVILNDTGADTLRYAPRDGAQRTFKVPVFPEEALLSTDLDDSRIARQGFGRGLCILEDKLAAAGSSPSTVTLYDLENDETLASINLSMDIRNAVHGLARWPW